MEDTIAADLETCFTKSKDGEVVELTEQMVVGRATSVLDRFAMALAFFVLATVPILFGAVQPWVWSIYTGMIYVAFVAYVWEQSRSGAGVGVSPYGVAVGLFFGVALFACLPLPNFTLALLSPVRYGLLQQAETLTGLNTVWSTLSYAPFHSLGWWAFLLGLAFWFVILKKYLTSPDMLNWACRILLMVAVIEGLYGIVQALIPNLGVLWVSYQKSGLGNARGTWINRNHFAGFMAMMLPLLIGYSLSRVRWGKQMTFKALLHSERVHQHSLFLLALVIVALAILFSKSRAGIVSGFIGTGTFIFLIRGADQALPKRVWFAFGGFLGMTLLYGLLIGFDPIIERFLSLGEGNSRLDYWKDSMAIVADHPLGIGLATFKFVFPVYNVTSMNEMITPHYLHNDVYQLLVETGWIGAGLLVGVFALFMVNSFCRIRGMGFFSDPQKFLLTAGAFSGLVSISFHSFFDFNLQVPANAVYFVALLAIVHVCSKPTLPGGGDAG